MKSGTFFIEDHMRRRFSSSTILLWSFASIWLAIWPGIQPQSVSAASRLPDLVGPPSSGRFGSQVAVLPTGNLVVSDPGYDAGSIQDVGAVYLYDGETGALISRLTGSQRGDSIASDGFTVLSNGNYVVPSRYWANGTATYAGAVTWCSGTTGCNGAVSAANSLVGDKANDLVGNGGVIEVGGGNYVALNIFWGNGQAAEVAGAMTWCDGATGCTGVVSAANSLVGSTAYDQIGYNGIRVLRNGNYVVPSRFWHNGAAASAGAATWCDGTTGCTGMVSPANSVVGEHNNDQVGQEWMIRELSNGNYVLLSLQWDNDSMAEAGAVTWCSGTAPCIGVISAVNSLVGNHAGDQVGNDDIRELANGNYVVDSPYWTNGDAAHAGAVTWCNGIAPCTGVVSATNSLVGDYASAWVGDALVWPLRNGNYVVASPDWSNGSVQTVGAVTWGDGTKGITGVVSAANSLVGSSPGDRVGSWGFGALGGDAYVVASPTWDAGAVADAGAVTWCNNPVGCTGEISTINSLVGNQANDRVGSEGITVLSNGNYVVRSAFWNSAGGAVTWGNGTTGITGVVSVANSLVGSQANDQVGNASITTLSNGNFVVNSSSWANGAAAGAGAVTWGNGTTGITGVVSVTNSLAGSHANDQVGNSGTTALSNGNYVTNSSRWANDGAAEAGAVTWGDGTTGITGVVSISNSLVGSHTNDWAGDGGTTPLSNGNYVVISPAWNNNGAIAGAGAVTWGSGTTGITGTISAANSVVGSHPGDNVGGGSCWWNVKAGVSPLSNGNYVVYSPVWDNGSVSDAGAITLGIPKTTNGPITPYNSVLGTATSDTCFLSVVYDNAHNRLIVGHPSGNIVNFLPQFPLAASTLDVNLSAASLGSSLMYTLTLRNASSVDLASVMVTDTLPVTLSYLPGSLAALSGAYDYIDGAIHWVGMVEASQSLTITFGATVNETAVVGDLVNAAVISHGGETITRTMTTTIFNPLTASTKSVDQSTASPGSSLIYVITLNNTSTVGVASVIVTDTLPAAIWYIPDSLTAPSGDFSYADGAIHWAGAVKASETITLSYAANVNNTVPSGEIINAAVISGGGGTIIRTASTRVIYRVYLPLATQKICSAGICGRVTLNGSPAGGLSLALRYYNGSTWSTRATKTTGSDGSYAFTNMPALGPGQEYYVRYQNSTRTAGRLWIWGTKSLTTYAAGSNADMGIFDIADIALVAPDSGAWVSLPYTFQWTPRPATPSDTYEFDLYDANNDEPYFYSALLGYVSGYSLNCLPAGFAFGTYYLWDVWVYSPDGGYGISYWSRWVTFSSGPSCAAAASQPDGNPLKHLPDDLSDAGSRPRP
jgi:uncharacterized repeat protein (TIGR01451 family)